MSQLSMQENLIQEKVRPSRRQRDSERTVLGLRFEDDVTRIGGGLLGTKVETLLRISQTVSKACGVSIDGGVRVSIPHMHVIATDYFEQFMAQNRLKDLPFDRMTDEEIAAAFVDAVLPTALIVHLYSLVERYGVPLSVRASRLTAIPFSYANNGIIQCKMVPNNQATIADRALVLQDAVKLIYASSFYRGYRDHLRCVGQSLDEEKTAVIIQKVVGAQYGNLFFPTITGTAYACNFFPQRQNGLYDGSASLMFGIAKGGEPDVVKPWCYALSSPSRSVPFTSSRHKLSATQNRFVAVDMSVTGGNRLDAFEYLTTGTLDVAERDPAFSLVASTYDAQNDRFIPGIGNKGARVIDFAPLLVLKTHKFNDALQRLQQLVEDALLEKVAIDFAVTTTPDTGALQVNILQVTPLFIHTMRVKIEDDSASDEKTLISSARALGNGVISPISDIVYIDPDTFTTENGQQAIAEVAAINREMITNNRRCIFIAMGRIGTTDPFRGLPVSWHQISSARVFIETDLPDTVVDFSGGSHFFSDLVSCGSFYFYVPSKGAGALDYDRLQRMTRVTTKKFVKHVRSETPLKIMVDGRTQRGVVVVHAHIS
jgi:hypothetical protein